MRVREAYFSTMILRSIVVSLHHSKNIAIPHAKEIFEKVRKYQLRMIKKP